MRTLGRSQSRERRPPLQVCLTDVLMVLKPLWHVAMPRLDAVRYLQKLGLPLGDHSLTNMAFRGIGPRYSIMQKKAIYLKKHIDEWFEAEMAKSEVKVIGKH
jgi:hypothetical protein